MQRSKRRRHLITSSGRAKNEAGSPWQSLDWWQASFGQRLHLASQPVRLCECVRGRPATV